MKFSIIIPLYNKRLTIRRAIYSALDQIGGNLRSSELIVVDDGSNDGSIDIVNSIQREHRDKEIIVYSQANAGVSAARNKGIELASADFVTFLDADDTYEPNFLDEVENLIDDFPEAAMFATSYRFIDSDKGCKKDAKFVGLSDKNDRQILSDYFFSAAVGDLPITSSSVCISKQALAELGGFPEDECMGEDQLVWSQIALKFPIAISKRVCANYFLAIANSLMETVPPANEMLFSRRLQTQLENGQVSHKLVSSIEKYIAGHLLDLVRRNLQINEITSAKIILSDVRARRQPNRWLYWYLRVRVVLYYRMVLTYFFGARNCVKS